ncbi:MAG: hypothetical protein PUB17_10840 [Lachnospiraceae bacterium]|nr:hypothetical protein [Lachnospiraceae bacterium]
MMAGKNEEEEYLDSLLNNAIKNDSELGDNAAEKDDADQNKEEAATLDELFKSMQTDDDYDDTVNADDEQSADDQMKFVNDLKDIVDQSAQDASISDAIEALNKESTISDEEPEPVLDDSAVQDNTYNMDTSEPDYNPDVNSNPETEAEEPEDFDYNDGEAAEPVLDDVPVLDDNFDMPSMDDYQPEPAMNDDSIHNDIQDAGTAIADNDNQDNATPEKSKKKKKDKKDKKNKKKKGLKSFFVEEYDDGDELGQPDDIAQSDADINKQLMDELYQDAGVENDLSDIEEKNEEPAEEEKPKKPKKEKKPKAPKEKKPKAPKVKKPVDKSERIQPDFGAIFKAVLIAAVISAVLIVGTNIFNKKSTIADAENAFDVGDYEEANELLSGLSLKGDDKDLYNKNKLLASIQRGLTSYQHYVDLNKKGSAVDSLIKAVGRKNKSEDLIEEYGIASQIDSLYSKITAALEENGLTEQEALDLYNMSSLEEYTAKLKGYGALVNDNKNK